MRDKSFITRGGGGYIQGGGRNFFGDVLGGLKIKIPWGRGVIYFIRNLGGSDVFHRFLLSLKVKASGPPPPPQDPPYPK